MDDISISKKTFAVVGSTGLIGKYIANAVLAEGHNLIAISRGQNLKNEAILSSLKLQGATLKFSEIEDTENLTNIFTGVDVVVALIHGTAAVIQEKENFILEAAKLAKVKRFIPSEFGCNTIAMKKGKGKLFDEKKNFQEVLRKSGIDFTIIYPGLIFNYSLPNLVEYDEITTYGDLDLKYPVTACEDIGKVTVRAALDDRCINKGVQIQANWISQREWKPLLEKYWKDFEFSYKHTETSEVLDLAQNGSETEPEEQPLIERMQITRACYIWGLAVGKKSEHHIDGWESDVLNAQDLFPDINFTLPEKAIQEKSFMFKQQ